MINVIKLHYFFNISHLVIVSNSKKIGNSYFLKSNTSILYTGSAKSLNANVIFIGSNI